MGSYGIGVGRLIASFIEANHDDKGIIWNKEIAPFNAILINVNPKDDEVTKKCDEIYQTLSQANEIIYDDEDLSFGQKLSRAELLGIPKIIIISKKTLEHSSAEVRGRKSGEVQIVKIEDL
jgi:prolyl-tRNA synthetase